MPTYLWRTEIFSIPATMPELMIYILFLVWAASKILTSPYPLLRKEGIYPISNIQYPILILGIVLLFLGLAISTALSDNLRISLGIMKGWFVDPFLFFLVLVSVIKTKKQIINLFGAWALSGLAVAVISLFYLAAGDLTYDGRLSAFFLSPNHLAMYLAPAFLILLFFLLKNNKVSSIKYQVLSIIFLITIIIPLYFTFSYGAFLGVAGAALCFFLLCFNRGSGGFSYQRKMATRLFSGIILCLFIILLLFSFSSDKFQQVADSQNRSSFHSRLMIWNSAKEILKDNFVFGIGPGTFQEVYLSYADRFDEPYLEWAVPQPHNIFLAFWLQTGIIGLAGFILILIWFFGSALKNRNTIHNPEHSGQFTIPIILMIYFLIHGLVDTTYWKNDLSLMFWILLGAMVVCSTDDLKTRPKDSKKLEI